MALKQVQLMTNFDRWHSGGDSAIYQNFPNKMDRSRLVELLGGVASDGQSDQLIPNSDDSVLFCEFCRLPGAIKAQIISEIERSLCHS